MTADDAGAETDPNLLIVGDGPRDGFSLPPLIANGLGRAITHRFQDWHYVTIRDGARVRTGSRMQGGKTVRRKLLFLLQTVLADGFDGLVIVADRDTAARRDRLREMTDWRAAARAEPEYHAVPIALGEANRHVEAWLLDDAQTVQEVCRLAAGAKVPAADCRQPKATVDGLLFAAGFGLEDGLAALAAGVVPDRCRRAGDTGLKQFLSDLRNEFAGLAADADRRAV